MSIEDEARQAVAEARSMLFRHNRQDSAPPPQPRLIPAARTTQQVQPSQPEVPHMSSPLLADAEKAAKALVSHIGSLLGNPLVDAVIEAGLGTVLTPGEVSAVVAFIQAIEAERAPNTAAAKPQASFTPTDGTGAQPVQGAAAAQVIA